MPNTCIDLQTSLHVSFKPETTSITYPPEWLEPFILSIWLAVFYDLISFTQTRTDCVCDRRLLVKEHFNGLLDKINCHAPMPSYGRRLSTDTAVTLPSKYLSNHVVEYTF